MTASMGSRDLFSTGRHSFRQRETEQDTPSRRFERTGAKPATLEVGGMLRLLRVSKHDVFMMSPSVQSHMCSVNSGAVSPDFRLFSYPEYHQMESIRDFLIPAKPSEAQFAVGGPDGRSVRHGPLRHSDMRKNVRQVVSWWEHRTARFREPPPRMRFAALSKAGEDEFRDDGQFAG